MDSHTFNVLVLQTSSLSSTHWSVRPSIKLYLLKWEDCAKLSHVWKQDFQVVIVMNDALKWKQNHSGAPPFVFERHWFSVMLCMTSILGRLTMTTGTYGWEMYCSEQVELCVQTQRENLQTEGSSSQRCKVSERSDGLLEGFDGWNYW